MGISVSSQGALKVEDDGTNVTISFGDTKLFRVRKSDNQFQVQAGVDTDTAL